MSEVQTLNNNPVLSRLCNGHTCTESSERQGVLTQEVIVWGVIMVLHLKANQSQVRDVDSEVEGTVPPWIKAWIIITTGPLFESLKQRTGFTFLLLPIIHVERNSLEIETIF